MRYLLTLPLNFIPVVGTAFFLGYNGALPQDCTPMMRADFRPQGWTRLPCALLPAQGL